MPVPLYFLIAMKSLEYTEDYLLVLGLDADSIVTHGKLPLAPSGLRKCEFPADPLAVFQRVADQILKYLLKVGRAHPYFGQRVVGDLPAALPDGLRQTG